MNKAEKIKLSREYLHFTLRFERVLQKKMQKELNSFIRAVHIRYLQGSTDFTDIEGQHFKKVYRILTEHYQKTMPIVSQWSVKQIEKINKSSLLDLVANKISYYIQSKGLLSAQSITATSRKKIRNSLDLGARLGLGVDEIARNIMSNTKLSGARSIVIARTETHAASNYAGIETARITQEEFDIPLQKEWIPVADERTRDTHAEMIDHPPIDLDANFNVGDSVAQAPLDNSLPPEELINCRCVLGYTAKEYGSF